MNQFIVVDFETTGNSPRQGDRIIQIGAVIVENGQVTDSYATFVNPEQPIPPFITSLTGITDEMVADAPTIEDVLPDVLRMIEGRTFVAHNASFDMTFLQEALVSQGYYAFDGDVIDTVELARLLLPMLGGYRLVELASYFDIQHENPHQADSDARATAHVLQHLLAIVEAMPLVTIQRLQMLVTFFRSDIAKLLRHVEMEKMMGELDKESGVGEERFDIYRQLAMKQRPSAVAQSKRATERIAATYEVDVLLEGLLGEEGSFSRHYAGYQRREAQEAMTRAIYAAMQEQRHLLVEAGTGVGKSLGYLLPSVLFAKRYNQQVVVSTHTINLQEQLFQKDIPLLEKSLPFPFTAALLKGRGNYLCLRKFEQSLEIGGSSTQEIQLTKAQLLTWLTQTESGDVEEVSLTPAGMQFWQQVKSDTHSCLHRDCPWFSRCYYFRAKQQSKEADVVIVNHALFTSDLEGEANILPAYDVAVVDEAHQLEEVASQQFGTEMNTQELYFLVDRLSTESERTMVTLFAGDLVMWNPALVEEIVKLRVELHKHYLKLRDQAQHWVQSFYNWASKRSKETLDSGRATVRYQPSDFTSKSGRMMTVTQRLIDNLSAFGQALEELYRFFAEGANEAAPPSLCRLATDLAGEIEELTRMTEMVHFLLIQEDHQHVSWIEVETRSSRKHVSFYKTPLEVGSLLAEKLFDKKRSVILTSATLTVKNTFAYFLERLGIDHFPPERVQTLALPSPFTYSEQGLILIPANFPALAEGDPTYIEAVIQGCIDCVRAAEGRTMILFTSYGMLRLVYEGMKAQLAPAEGFTLLGHGVDSNNRSKLIRAFQREPKAILFGASSFWEGVDIPGEALSCLVIVRLPFQPPNMPLLESRSEAAKREKKNPFMSLHLPHAIIRFKQGIGRLIRHQTDRGVIVVFDPRIVEARYGRMFLQSLPPYLVETGAWPELRETIRPFLMGIHPANSS